MQDFSQDSFADYERVQQALDYLSKNWREQPSLETMAAEMKLSPTYFQKLFTRWAGISPKEFLQVLTLDHAKNMLKNASNVLDATYDSGLSSPGRLHDLFVTYEALSPGEFKARGEGLKISYGWCPSPFGQALVMASERGLTGLAFADIGQENAVFEDMASRLPCAHYVEDSQKAARLARNIFQLTYNEETPLRLHVIGTNFEIKVWETLLKIPVGQAITYSDIARAIKNPKAVRAVGSAVGRNPISFVVPCHRVLGKSGGLCGYHWGLTRKKAILGWESGKLVSSGQ
jgi:AraC family transcriptional regulator of adaptative response/methylated-DNA-[protein]-cysteine methyltransferase